MDQGLISSSRHHTDPQAYALNLNRMLVLLAHDQLPEIPLIDTHGLPRPAAISPARRYLRGAELFPSSTPSDGRAVRDDRASVASLPSTNPIPRLDRAARGGDRAVAQLPKEISMNTLQRIFISRKVWIALGAAAVVICSVLGLDADQATKITAAITTLAFAVIAAIAHEDAAEKSAPENVASVTNVNPVASSSGSTPSPNLIAMLLIPALFLFACVGGGCTSSPTGQAAEVRALFNEAQVQVDQLCQDPATNPAKCEELKAKLAQASPFIDALEVAAAGAETNPGEYVNFQTLWVQYKPRVEGILISIVLRRYLGT